MLSFILAFWKAVKAFDREVGAWGEGFALLEFPMEVQAALVQRVVAKYTEKDLNGAMVAPAIVSVPDKDRRFMMRWDCPSRRVSIEGNDTYITVRLRSMYHDLTIDHSKDGFKFLVKPFKGAITSESVDGCINVLNSYCRGGDFSRRQMCDLAVAIASLGSEFETSDLTAEQLDYWAAQVEEKEKEKGKIKIVL